MKVNQGVPNHILISFLIGGIVLSLGLAAFGLVFTLGTRWGGAKTGPDLPPVVEFSTSTPVLFNTEIPSPTPDISPPGTADPLLNTPEITPPAGTQTESAAPTLTPTPSPTHTPGSATQPSDWAALVKSSPANGVFFGPSDAFKQKWTVKNIGTTTWTTNFDLVFVSGTRMTDRKAVAIPEKVAPGQSIQLSISMAAPKNPGIYQGSWKLRNSKGDLFGTGTEAKGALPVEIVVLNVDPNAKYDFILNYCNAAWRNTKDVTLPCPGREGSASGFVVVERKPVLENGTSDKPVLWVHPYNISGGKISGEYPAVNIKAGDHFKAKVGCMGGYSKCNVTFHLNYQIGQEKVKSLGSWKELYGGGITTIDVDLSHLAGEKVRFILRADCTNKTPDAAQGFWMNPKIIYIKPTPTPTETPTNTPTPTETPTSTPTPTETPFGG